MEEGWWDGMRAEQRVVIAIRGFVGTEEEEEEAEMTSCEDGALPRRKMIT